MPETAFPTPLGTCRIRWQDNFITGFRLPESSDTATANITPPDWIQVIIQRVRLHLERHFQDFSDLPYHFAQVGEFPRAVYGCTLQIKAGSTSSYGDIARQLGYPPATSRAVGTALGANPWPLLVPCHRVVAADGKMTGFSGPGGIETKLKLLALEGAQLFDV